MKILYCTKKSNTQMSNIHRPKVPKSIIPIQCLKVVSFPATLLAVQANIQAVQKENME